jgi:predicted phosphoribosyltransferase
MYRSPRARKRAAKWRLAQLIKLHRGCKDCGYAAHAVALQFDHRGDKRMNVSDMIRSDYSWTAIKQEIDKCDVRCANCHSVVSAQQRVFRRFRSLSDEEIHSLVASTHSIDEASSILSSYPDFR